MTGSFSLNVDCFPCCAARLLLAKTLKLGQFLMRVSLEVCLSSLSYTLLLSLPLLRVLLLRNPF